MLLVITLLALAAVGRGQTTVEELKGRVEALERALEVR